MRVPEIKLWSAEPTTSGEILRDFLIADVFTGTPLVGNQLGIFPDGRGLSAEQMLRATREMNYSETVFFLPPSDPAKADAHVRIFTHASGAITFGRMSQPVPELAGPYEQAAELLAALGTPPAPDGLPIQTYVNGPVNVYVEFADEQTVAALEPDLQLLGKIKANVSCFAQTDRGVTTRMFAPALGVTEDPATGSAAGPLAVHLARHGRIPFGEEIEILQGAQVHRPSVLYARIDGTASQIERVLVGGQAVVVATGQYRLS